MRLPHWGVSMCVNWGHVVSGKNKDTKKTMRWDPDKDAKLTEVREQNRMGE